MCHMLQGQSGASISHFQECVIDAGSTAFPLLLLEPPLTRNQQRLCRVSRRASVVIPSLRSWPLLDQERAAYDDASEQTIEQMRAFASLGTRLATSRHECFSRRAYVVRCRSAVRYAAVTGGRSWSSVVAERRAGRPASHHRTGTGERCRQLSKTTPVRIRPVRKRPPNERH